VRPAEKDIQKEVCVEENGHSGGASGNDGIWASRANASRATPYAQERPFRTGLGLVR
jgi:hypothetical protein